MTQMNKWKKATSRTSCLLPDGGIKISLQNSKSITALDLQACTVEKSVITHKA